MGNKAVMIDNGRYYIGELRRGRRRALRFAHEMWNVFQQVNEYLPKTNNILKGWDDMGTHFLFIALKTFSSFKNFKTYI